MPFTGATSWQRAPVFASLVTDHFTLNPCLFSGNIVNQIQKSLIHKFLPNLQNKQRKQRAARIRSNRTLFLCFRLRENVAFMLNHDVYFHVSVPSVALHVTFN
jgi:hypothetical protein